MEELEKIEQQLFTAQKELVKELNLGEDDSSLFTIVNVRYYVSSNRYEATSEGNDGKYIGLCVKQYDDSQRIEIIGNVSEAIKLAKQMKNVKQHIQLIRE
jgi:hypothetical protein